MSAEAGDVERQRPRSCRQPGAVPGPSCPPAPACLTNQCLWSHRVCRRELRRAVHNSKPPLEAREHFFDEAQISAAYKYFRELQPYIGTHREGFVMEATAQVLGDVGSVTALAGE